MARYRSGRDPAQNPRSQPEALPSHTAFMRKQYLQLHDKFNTADCCHN